jgi:hypothetical protein
MYHWNEDPHSVPDPLIRKNSFTSTVARYYKDGKMDDDTEVKGINPRYHTAYNKNSPEPKNPTWYDYVQTASDSSSDSSDSEDENVQTLSTTRVGETTLWHVAPDYGELDDHVVDREADVANGKKKSGWTNPLGWTDNGSGDEQFLNVKQDIDMVKAQFQSLLQYAESEGPTKADNGEDDDLVLGRDPELRVNPLKWTDNGANDDTVLTQYAESEGPTKADNGEDDDLVLGRDPELRVNPLKWTDNGSNDDTVV